MNTAKFTHCLLLAGLALLAGCAALPGLGERDSGAQAGGPLRAGTPVAEPLSRNFFVLSEAEQSVIGELQVVRVAEGDTFSDLAREYGLGYDEMLAANPGIDPWLPVAGTPVLLPTQYVLPRTPRRGLVLNVAAKRLFYFPAPDADGRQTVLTYPIGIGRVGWETPLGTSKVIAKAVDPTWWVPASVRAEHEALGDPLPAVVPPGPDNPLGRHVLKLDLPGYLIHGTNQPYGVGMRVSHGCVRLYPENIASLYELVALGEPVTLVNEPWLLGQRDGQWFFEAHPPLEDAPLELDAWLADVVAADALPASRRDHVAMLAADALGVPVRLAPADADEIYERAILVRNTVEPDPEAPSLSEVREMLDALPPVDSEPGGSGEVAQEGGR